MPLGTVITGLAVRSALGEDAEALWAAVQSGASALAPARGFDASGFGDPRVAQVWTEAESAEDDPALRILGSHGRLLDGVARAAHAAADLAALPREEVGLFVGLGMVDAPQADLVPAALASRDADGRLSLTRFFAGGYRSVHPLWPLSMLGNVAAGQVAIDLDLRGDNLVTASDADAGLRALLEAARSVHDGACRAALAGGASGRVGPACLARLTLQGRLPGVSPGEGGAALVLEGEASAAGRGRTVLARVRGGATAFGRAGGRPGPDAAAFERALTAALTEAGASGADLVLAHADGHPATEEAEAAALERTGLSGARRVTSKRAVGHLGAGAAALDACLAAQALQAGTRRAVVVAAGAYGGAGALVLEAA
jgi:3-oxoacyl-(acyl-carrier-protein) synthase